MPFEMINVNDHAATAVQKMMNSLIGHTALSGSLGVHMPTKTKNRLKAAR